MISSSEGRKRSLTSYQPSKLHEQVEAAERKDHEVEHIHTGTSDTCGGS